MQLTALPAFLDVQHEHVLCVLFLLDEANRKTAPVSSSTHTEVDKRLTQTGGDAANVTDVRETTERQLGGVSEDERLRLKENPKYSDGVTEGGVSEEERVKSEYNQYSECNNARRWETDAHLDHLHANQCCYTFLYLGINHIFQLAN